MIQAVACGHSIGSVHKVDFPEIVGDEPTTDPNGTGADTFDSTPFNFDNTQLQEYLTGKGKRGGPLVTTKNVTMRSDLRIFTSDNNATVKAMSSADSFRNTCLTIFEKMLNTVPKNVTLSDPVVPRPWITQESHLDLSSSGTLFFSGNITTNEKALKTAPGTASYVFLTSSGSTVKSGTSKPARKSARFQKEHVAPVTNLCRETRHGYSRYYHRRCAFCTLRSDYGVLIQRYDYQRRGLHQDSKFLHRTD